MRRIQVAMASLIALVSLVLAQDIPTDAKRALGDEWQNYPEHCLAALKSEFSEQPSPKDALSELKKDQNAHIQQVYDEAIKSGDFWEWVVMATVTPAKATKKEQEAAAFAACSSAEKSIDALYLNSGIPILRKALDSYQANLHVAALYQLLISVPKTSDTQWKKDMSDYRVCYSYETFETRKGNQPGTRLFGYVGSHFPSK